MRILVFTTDMIPFAGYPTSGTALRTYGFIKGLQANGHEVVISPPRDAVHGFRSAFDVDSLEQESAAQFRDLEALAFDSFNQAQRISEVNPDVVICGHWPAMMLHTKPSVPLIVDLAGPHLLERHYQGEDDEKGLALAKLRAAATADYFIVSGPRQRLYFLSFLLRAGVRNPETRTHMIRMPLNPELPDRMPAADYPQLVFGGVFLPWQDPSWGLQKTVDFLEDKAVGSLKLIGGKHPNYSIDQGSYQKVFDRLEKSPQVSRLPMLPYEQFIGELGSSHAAIDVMAWNLERQLAVTIRTTTYLWAGVPVIYNDYADLGDLIRNYDAGWCVAPGDDAALEQVLDEIINSPHIVEQKSLNAQHAARTEFAWDKAVQPLLELLSAPETSPLRETDVIVDRMESADYDVFGPQTVRQYFLCRINGLTRVECRIATHDRTISKDLTLSLYEVETDSYRPSAAELRNAGMKLVEQQAAVHSSLINNEWIGFDFAPLSGSAGKVYCLELSCPDAQRQQAISPWAMKASPYPLLTLRYGDSEVKHMCLCMRSVSVETVKAAA